MDKSKRERFWEDFEKFAEEIRKEAKEKGITEKDLQNELEKVRKEMWEEQKKRYQS